MRILRITIALILLLFAGIHLSAQSSDIYTTQTKLLIQSEDNKAKPFTAFSESAFMNLSLSTGEFLLKADMSDMKTGDRQLDSLIATKGSQPFTFKGKIVENLMLFGEQANDEKSYNLEGQLTINNTSLACVAQYDPVNFGEKTQTNSYRMDFKLSVDPTKITILGLENKLNRQLVFEVMDGIVNTKP
jgi:hypothetical protein